MGTQLIREYDKAKQLGGLKAQMRLAILTKISGPKAATLPDSVENIRRFEMAMQELFKEFRQEHAR
ncbi:MAG: hypothetical protein RIT27_734 [Pseudomonadota bacterium]|jgi:hypothetical protein